MICRQFFGLSASRLPSTSRTSGPYTLNAPKVSTQAAWGCCTGTYSWYVRRAISCSSPLLGPQESLLVAFGSVSHSWGVLMLYGQFVFCLPFRTWIWTEVYLFVMFLIERTKCFDIVCRLCRLCSRVACSRGRNQTCRVLKGMRVGTLGERDQTGPIKKMFTV